MIPHPLPDNIDDILDDLDQTYNEHDVPIDDRGFEAIRYINRTLLANFSTIRPDHNNYINEFFNLRYGSKTHIGGGFQSVVLIRNTPFRVQYPVTLFGQIVQGDLDPTSFVINEKLFPPDDLTDRPLSPTHDALDLIESLTPSYRAYLSKAEKDDLRRQLTSEFECVMRMRGTVKDIVSPLLHAAVQYIMMPGRDMGKGCVSYGLAKFSANQAVEEAFNCFHRDVVLPAEIHNNIPKAKRVKPDRSHNTPVMYQQMVNSEGKLPLFPNTLDIRKVHTTPNVRYVGSGGNVTKIEAVEALQEAIKICHEIGGSCAGYFP